MNKHKIPFMLVRLPFLGVSMTKKKKFIKHLKWVTQQTGNILLYKKVKEKLDHFPHPQADIKKCFLQKESASQQSFDVFCKDFGKKPIETTRYIS